MYLYTFVYMSMGMGMGVGTDVYEQMHMLGWLAGWFWVGRSFV